jgi:hypothetical protein
MSLNGLVTTAWLIPLYALVAWAGALIWSPGITRRTGPRPAGYLNALLDLEWPSCTAWGRWWQFGISRRRSFGCPGCRWGI